MTGLERRFIFADSASLTAFPEEVTKENYEALCRRYAAQINERRISDNISTAIVDMSRTDWLQPVLSVQAPAPARPDLGLEYDPDYTTVVVMIGLNFFVPTFWSDDQGPKIEVRVCCWETNGRPLYYLHGPSPTVEVPLKNVVVYLSQVAQGASPFPQFVSK